MTSPVVSCIVIFLNEERFLQEATDSIFAQTFDDWELLLVDDGSTDGSTEIARRLAAKHPERVRYYEHEGHATRGMSAARNLGIRNSRGRYVAFLDADDVWLPEKLRIQVELLQRHPDAAMVYGDTEYWFSWTGDPGAKGRDFVPRSPMPPDAVARPPALLLGLLAEVPPAATCSMLLKREALERAGGFEESFPGLFEDQAFLAKLYRTEPVFVSSACVARYRMHTGSHVFREVDQGRYPAARLSFLAWLGDYLERTGERDPRIRKALRAARSRHRYPILGEISTGGRRLSRRLALRTAIAAGSVGRRMRGASGTRVGSLAAHPNPIRLSDPFSLRFAVGVTTLSWEAKGVEVVEVRVNAADGPLVSRAGPTGSVTTGQWVTDGMVFYLQDRTAERPLTLRNTLDAVEVAVTNRTAPS